MSSYVFSKADKDVGFQFCIALGQFKKNRMFIYSLYTSDIVNNILSANANIF